MRLFAGRILGAMDREFTRRTEGRSTELGRRRPFLFALSVAIALIGAACDPSTATPPVGDGAAPPDLGNAVVRDLNILRESFPSVLVARAFGFGPGTYFALDHDNERAVPSGSLERDRR